MYFIFYIRSSDGFITSGNGEIIHLTLNDANTMPDFPTSVESALVVLEAARRIATVKRERLTDQRTTGQRNNDKDSKLT